MDIQIKTIYSNLSKFVSTTKLLNIISKQILKLFLVTYYTVH